MANTYFQFKKFTVNQDKSAMKVCTDSCIFGAYASFKNPASILDIGTGTGLLSLMLAQKYKCPIDAVEIDTLSASQAAENFLNSQWSERLNIYNESIQDFEGKCERQYDLIICNPPFFEDHLKSPDPQKNKAIHNDKMSYKDLVLAAKKLLANKGFFYVLLPEYQSSLFEIIALKQFLFPIRKLTILNSDKTAVFRVITVFSPTKQEFVNETLIIKDADGGYTPTFKLLLKDYYLHL